MTQRMIKPKDAKTARKPRIQLKNNEIPTERDSS